MLTVVVLNYRDYLGQGARYVDTMRRMLERHIHEPFGFNEITERELPANGRTGWWCKATLLEMFNGPGTKLFLDLDVVVTADLSPLIELARTDHEVLWMRDDFSYPRTPPYHPGLDADFIKYLGGPGTCQSSVMLWHRSPDLRGFDLLMAEVHGDQNAITKLLWHKKGIKLLPNDQIKSFKYHPGEAAPIIAFHGSPKPHEVTDRYIVENWR